MYERGGHRQATGDSPADSSFWSVTGAVQADSREGERLLEVGSGESSKRIVQNMEAISASSLEA